jgi:hypothetical protein
VAQVKVLKEVQGVKVKGHTREWGGDTCWDYYDLADGRHCLYSNGFFWEWLDL